MATHQVREREEPQQLPIHMELMTELTAPAVAAATTFQQRLVENMTACQKEWYGFVHSRWQENISMPKRLSRCKTPMDVQLVYMDYWRRALEQYSGEFQQLGEMAQCDVRHNQSLSADDAGESSRPPARPESYAHH